MLTSLVTAAFAIAPGVVAWWTGRALGHRTGDPALPELLMARQQRLLKAGALAAAVVIVGGGRHAFWGIPLTMAAVLAGGYPLRRALREETVSLPRHLWLSFRSIAGSVGFWLLLASTPAIVLATDQIAWVVALALLPLLLLWEHWYPELWLRLHDAVPITSGALVPRVEQIVQRAGTPAPALYRVGAPGTRFANAVALPSLRGGAIALGNALLELLEPDEAAAIYAHELSHIEQFGPRVLRRLQMINRLMIVAAVAAPLVVHALVPDQGAWIGALWVPVPLIALVARARRSQQRETESDLRAAALCGDADTVARALVKLHVHALIPRRWPVDLERGASHPSLARRIQALRGHGAEAVAALGAPVVLPVAPSGSVVVFDDTRAWWFDGVPPETPHTLDALRAQAASLRSVAWDDLVELRVAASGDGRALVAARRNGERWRVPLDASRVAEVQRALDQVDVRLHRELGKRPVAGAARIAALAVVLAMFAAGQTGVLLVPVALALWRPAAVALAALGAMALGRAGLAAALGDVSWLVDNPARYLALLAVLGAVCLGLAWHARGERAPRVERLTLLVLGALTVLLVAGIVIAGSASAVTAGGASGVSLGELPLLSTLAVTLLGGAAALLVSGSRGRRWAGAAAAVMAIVIAAPAVAAAGLFDGGEPVTERMATAVETSRLALDEGVTGLRLSPGGARFLVQRYARDGRPTLLPSRDYLVGDTAGVERTTNALLLDFVDDAHVLAVRAGDDGMHLSLERADSAIVLWSATVPELYEPTLTIAPGGRTWWLAGQEARTDSMLIATGALSTAAPPAPPPVRIHRFAPIDSLSTTEPLVFDGGERFIALDFTTAVHSLFPVAIMAMWMPSVDLVEVSAAGHRRVGALPGFPQCGPPDGEVALCVARQRTRTSLWVVSPRGVVRAPRIAPGLYGSVRVGPGLRLVATDFAGGVIALDLPARQLTTVTFDRGSEHVTEAGIAGERAAVLWYREGGMSLAWYRLQVSPR